MAIKPYAAVGAGAMPAKRTRMGAPTDGGAMIEPMKPAIGAGDKVRAVDKGGAVDVDKGKAGLSAKDLGGGSSARQKIKAMGGGRGKPGVAKINATASAAGNAFASKGGETGRPDPSAAMAGGGVRPRQPIPPKKPVV